MPNADPNASRRGFLRRAGVLAAGLSAAPALAAQDAASDPAVDRPEEPPVDPDAITPETIREAEKLVGVDFEAAERELIARTIGQNVERFRRRMAFEFSNDQAPAQTVNPREVGGPVIRTRASRPGSARDLPRTAEDIAYAPLTDLSAWVRTGAISSVDLTKLYLQRLKTIGPKLECVATLTEDLALRQAAAADADIAAGRHRGPLHGIPWGAKDLLDTKGITTGWGATPYKDRVPDRDATVVQRLADAGAVLVAKLTLGALAYGDIWHGGTTRNPFNLRQGSSGSSAGSAAATAAGLVGFAIGTETLGSIVSPCMRCGTTGLRPTFGRVPRTGAMALCWSLDKIGPICRATEDTLLVLEAIHGADDGDPSSVSRPLDAAITRDDAAGLRIGVNPAWFEGERATLRFDRAARDALREAGAELVEVTLPDRPYDALLTILMVEAASAFEEITLKNTDDDMVWQAPQAWPNGFRETRFTPAIEYVQAERLRRLVMNDMAAIFENVDALISPSYAASLLLITNNTGHPSLTVRTGFMPNGSPHGTTLWGRLDDEGTLGRLGRVIERSLKVWDRRPKV